MILFKKVLVSGIRYKNEIILVLDVVNQNDFLFVKKYLSMMKDVFSVENHILDDDVSMSLPSSYQTVQTQSTYVYRCIWRTS